MLVPARYMIFVLLLWVMPAHADLLWDNNLISDGTAGRALSPPGFPDIRVVDDFIVPESGWSLTGFSFGAIVDPKWTDGGITDIFIWSDSGDAGPDELLFEVRRTHTMEDTGMMFRDRRYFLFHIEDLSITLPEGRYFIGPRNSHGGGEGTNWWMTSDGGPDGMDTDGGWFSLDGGNTWMPETPRDRQNHAFEIRGRIIPAPGGLAILGGVLLIRRRRRT